MNIRTPAESVGTQADPGLHQQQRDLLSPAFRPDAVRQMAGLLAAGAERLAGVVEEQVKGVVAAGGGDSAAAVGYLPFGK